MTAARLSQHAVVSAPATSTMAGVANIEAVVHEARTFDEAIRQRAIERGRPVTWNVWQQAASRLRALFPAAAPDSHAVDYRAGISLMRDRIMEEIHGPEWKRLILMSAPVPALPAEIVPSEPEWGRR